MKNFKFIAVRPLKNCDTRFSKILTWDTVYSFYDEYDFKKYSDNHRAITIGINPSENLYSFTNVFNKEINLNISAIVGHNGTGKSSIVELLYVACYNISSILGILFDEEEKRYLSAKDAVPDINVELFYEINGDHFLIVLKGVSINFFKYSNGIFTPSKKAFHLSDFFYTLAINYSLHALNSKVLGDWISKLFHKNDSYQTPIVLNPFRKEGNIDINNEEYLIKSRLITNILGKIDRRQKPENSLRNVIDKKIAHKLFVELNREKFKYDNREKPIFEYTERDGKLILPLVYKHFLKNKNFAPENTLLNRYAQEYIIYKIHSIVTKYQPYKRLFSGFESDSGQADALLFMLHEDKSHVTFKLVQAINFLTNELYFKRGESFALTVAHLSKTLNEKSRSVGKELINILPPPFFKVDIEFKDAGMFSLLSSGEKQRVYSIATLIYHLSNLSSANGKLVDLKYKMVSVIFDEIELYFHPELQRNLVNDIIQNIKKINLDEIYAINMLLITHSPFILSDIPESNILFLTEDGLPELNRDQIRTFGGNIHELLAHSFFLENGLIGEFAKDSIQQIIDKLQIKEDEKARIVDPKPLWKQIQIIGEPFLRNKLIEMYYEKFDKQNRIKELRAELKKLENDQTP